MRFLFVDRILQLSPAKTVRGVKHITYEDHYLCRDETTGKLCFIPSLIGETLGQLAAWNVMVSNHFTSRPVAGVVGSAHLYRPAYAGETLLLESFIDSLDEVAVRYHGVARVGDEVIFRIENALGPLLPMNEFIDSSEVRRQFSEIDKPDEWPPILNYPLKTPVETLVEPILHCPPMKFDKIVSHEPGVCMCVEKYISRTAPYFPDHFPNKPVLPMTVLLEWQLNLTREFVNQAPFSKSYHIREMRKIKMNAFVHPGDVLVSTLKLKNHKDGELILSSRSEVKGRRVCVLDLVLTSKDFI